MTTMLESLMRLYFLSLILLCCVSPSSFTYINLDTIINIDYNSYVACRPHQIQALTEFKNEFDTRSCNHSDPFNGVWCNNSTGMITRLQLRACLSGTLKPNSSLFRFHHLRFLHLHQNNFISSSLPSEFGNLNRLEVLALDSNGFVGQVPFSFNNLNLLSVLSLYDNELTGSLPLVQNLTKLVALDLLGNQFSGTLNPKSSLFELHHLRYLNLGFNKFSSSIPSEFGNLNRLEFLCLSSNDFFGQVPPTFSNLTSLTELHLDQNKLTGSFPLARNLTKLVALDLSSNHFFGSLSPTSSLFEFHHLRYLNLHANKFSSSIPSELGNLNRLEVLSLSSNNFFGQVPHTISNLTSLTKVHLYRNNLTGCFPLVQNLTKLSKIELYENHFPGTIPSSLLTMPFLSYLDLSGNNFSGSIGFPNTSSPSRLETMYLGDNYFEGKILEPISKLINLKKLGLSLLNTSYPIDLSLFSSLKSLSSLDLSGNSISPASLGSNSYMPPNLEFLYLVRCGISEFPTILKSLPNLVLIELSNNRIKGKVPEWIWKLPRLRLVSITNNSFNGFEGPAEVLVNSSLSMLYMSHNCFEGAIPILPLSIIFLDAENNRFTGIPLSICNRSSLAALYLSYNNLTGPIPPCLSILGNLTIVVLRKNNLEGSLPDMFYDGASLQTLDVGYNRLTGKLPRSLVNCSSLQFLNVHNNKIQDTFPFWLKVLPNLQVLILRSNELFGSISPPDQGPLGFPELRIFEISDNTFTGSLPPSYFENWKASSFPMNEDRGLYMEYSMTNYKVDIETANTIDLRYKGLSMEQKKVFTSYATIDISGNRFEGQIPESIGLLKALFALNLSNNAFTGHIPLSFSNFTELESLDLSSNQLSGTIPSGLGSLSYLEYINVSHNQLKGEIPQGTQITGQPKSSFEGNAGLCGLPLEESCFGSNAPPTEQPKDEEEEEEEEVFNWKGVVIGYGFGVLLGLAIAQVIASYKPQWLIKIIGTDRKRNR